MKMGKISEDKTLDQGTRTMLDFRDVSKELEKGTLEFLKKYDVIRNIKIGEAKISKKGKVIYHFNVWNYQNMYGMIFPCGEIVEVGRTCDIIIEKAISVHPLYVHACVYHDLYKGETILVRITGRGKKLGDPSFKLFNGITGYITSKDHKLNKQIGIGTKLYVEVKEFTKIGKGGILQVKASENLEDVV